MAGQVQLPSGRQPVSAVVAPAAHDQGVAPGIPAQDQLRHPEGRPLHEHRPRDAHVLDGRPVEFAHLGGPQTDRPGLDR